MFSAPSQWVRGHIVHHSLVGRIPYSQGGRLLPGPLAAGLAASSVGSWGAGISRVQPHPWGTGVRASPGYGLVCGGPGYGLLRGVASSVRNWGAGVWGVALSVGGWGVGVSGRGGPHSSRGGSAAETASRSWAPRAFSGPGPGTGGPRPPGPTGDIGRPHSSVPRRFGTRSLPGAFETKSMSRG